MQTSDYSGFIMASYGIAFAVLIGMAAISIVRYVRARRAEDA